MRCYECGVAIEPGPVVCPDCGGDVGLNFSDVAEWAGRRISGPLQKSTGRTTSFMAIMVVGLAGARISAPATAEFVDPLAADNQARAMAGQPVSCSFQCSSNGLDGTSYTLRWQYKADEIAPQTLLQAYAIEAAELACELFGDEADESAAQACASDILF